MRTRSSQIILIGLLLALPSLLTDGGAEEVGTSATIRNLDPEIVAIQVLFDERLGAFLYEVRARDPNGAPDLDRAVFHFLDREDHVATHTDRDGTRDGGTVVWKGIATAGRHLLEGPFRVHLHVYDRHDAAAEAEVPATLLPAVDLPEPVEERVEKRGIGHPRALVPLLQGAEVRPPPQLGLIGLFSLLLVAIVCVAWRATANDQRRSGGRPGGR